MANIIETFFKARKMKVSVSVTELYGHHFKAFAEEHGLTMSKVIDAVLAEKFEELNLLNDEVITSEQANILNLLEKYRKPHESPFRIARVHVPKVERGKLFNQE